MGYELPERTVLFAFEDGPLKGLEATFRVSLSFDEFFELQAAAEAASAKKAGLAEVRTFVHRVAELGLRSWNVTDHGEPVPATADAFVGRLDIRSATQLVYRYLGGIGLIADPFGPPSRSPATSGRKSRRSPSKRSAPSPSSD